MKGPGAPLVSVIIPVFNAAATLEETLRSVADQTYANLEILIVDDGSTDLSVDIAALFCAGDGRARLLRKRNGGVASARNAGLAEARGDYCAPVDADDLWHPTKIARQMKVMLAAPEPPSFVYCWFRHIDGQGQVWRDGPAFEECGAAIQRLVYCNFVGNGSALLFRREAALAVGGYDDRLQTQGAQGCEDLLLQLQLAKRGPVAAVPEYLVGYRFSPGSMSHDWARMRRSWQEALRIFDQEGGRVLPWVARRNEGRRSLLEAETAALRHAYGTSALLLWRSLRFYPARTMFVLACRLARRAGKRRAPTPGFFHAQQAVVATPPDRWLAAIQRFDERRLRELRAEDVEAPLLGASPEGMSIAASI